MAHTPKNLIAGNEKFGFKNKLSFIFNEAYIMIVSISLTVLPQRLLIFHMCGICHDSRKENTFPEIVVFLTGLHIAINVGLFR